MHMMNQTDVQQCTFSVENSDLYVDWLVGWGFIDAGYGWKIVCNKGPIPE
jgi:hypothetical protein